MHYIIWKLQQQNLRAQEERVKLNLDGSSQPSGILVSGRSRLPIIPAPDKDKEFSASDMDAEE